MSTHSPLEEGRLDSVHHTISRNSTSFKSPGNVFALVGDYACADVASRLGQWQADHTDYEQYQALPFTLSHVCSAWRTAALAQPALWRLVLLNLRHITKISAALRLEHLDAVLLRSAGAQLDICIYFGHGSALQTALVERLSREMGRCRFLRMEIPQGRPGRSVIATPHGEASHVPDPEITIMRPIITSRVPQLEHLDVVCKNLGPYNERIGWFPCASRLRTVTTAYPLWQTHMEPAPSVTALRLTRSYWNSGDVISALHLFPQLATLHITVDHIADDPTPPDPQIAHAPAEVQTFPALRVLHMKAALVSPSFCAWLRLPGVHTATLQTAGGTYDPAHVFGAGLIALRALEITCPTAGTRLADALRLLPALERVRVRAAQFYPPFFAGLGESGACPRLAALALEETLARNGGGAWRAALLACIRARGGDAGAVALREVDVSWYGIQEEDRAAISSALAQEL